MLVVDNYMSVAEAHKAVHRKMMEVIRELRVIYASGDGKITYEVYDRLRDLDIDLNRLPTLTEEYANKTVGEMYGDYPATGTYTPTAFNGSRLDCTCED